MTLSEIGILSLFGMVFFGVYVSIALTVVLFGNFTAPIWYVKFIILMGTAPLILQFAMRIFRPYAQGGYYDTF